MLWGGFAQKKGKIIADHHIVLQSAHPSPLGGAAWNGCNIFANCNEELEKQGFEPIDWTLPQKAGAA